MINLLRKNVLLILLSVSCVPFFVQTSFAQATIATFGFKYVLKKDKIDNSIEVLEVLNNTDAKSVGIKSGDYIVEMQGKPLVNLSNDEIVEIIKVAKLQKILTVKKRGETNELSLNLKELSTYICLSGNCKEGKVKIADVFNFYEYEGDFKGNYNGQGTLTFTGVGTNYPAYHIKKQVGTFASGKFINGITYYSFGKFEGKVYNGVPEGEGVYTDNNGQIFKGTFTDGVFMNGISTYTDSNGNIKQMKFENGKEVKE